MSSRPSVSKMRGSVRVKGCCTRRPYCACVRQTSRGSKARFATRVLSSSLRFACLPVYCVWVPQMCMQMRHADGACA